MDQIGVCDVGLDDESPPGGGGAVEEDAGPPQWLKVLLWKTSTPKAEVWVTCPAESQPEGALWVGKGVEPGPGDAMVVVRGSRAAARLVVSKLAHLTSAGDPISDLKGLLDVTARVAASRREVLVKLRAALSCDDSKQALELARCLVGLREV